QRLGSPGCSERAGRILGWLGLPAEDRGEHWPHWCDEFLTNAGEPRADIAFVSKAVCDAHPGLVNVFRYECQRILGVIDACRALRVVAVSSALLTLAAPVLRSYAAHKEASGLLDYDDLIGRTSGLLVDPGAAWVLYKLDGGLDHLLLDEVQDTSPALARGKPNARCLPWVIASSRSIRSRVPIPRSSIVRTGCLHDGSQRRASFGAKHGSMFRSARRHRCWTLWIACLPIRLRRPGWSMPGKR
ncbi:MAG TPA: UvrD-helicase domain-containing protein, partial [Steroidobacteraceae bacterium]